MIPLWLGKFIATRAIKAIKHRIDLNKIDKYVNKPNELDKIAKSHEKRLKKLEKNSHPPIFGKQDYKDILKRLKKLEK